MKIPKRRRDEAALNSRLIRRPIKRMVWLFLLPTFAAFCIGFLYPFFKGLFLSFCNFRITSQWEWTGLDNYRKAFQDPGYMHAFWYTALFALVSLLAINLFAFTIAYALTQKFKGTNVFRTVFFLPNLIGGIVLGYIWQILLNGILSALGKPLLALNATYGFWGLIILMCWQQIGYMMIIYIAGLQNVPTDLIEAARIGALSLEKLEAMTCVCSVGLDMIAVPGDTPASTIAAIIADEAAIGMVNSKTTAVRIIPAPGKTVGDEVEFGGLFGRAPIMRVSPYSAEAFIARGGRIPAPLQSLKN